MFWLAVRLQRHFCAAEDLLPDLSIIFSKEPHALEIVFGSITLRLCVQRVPSNIDGRYLWTKRLEFFDASEDIGRAISFDSGVNNLDRFPQSAELPLERSRIRIVVEQRSKCAGVP